MPLARHLVAVVATGLALLALPGAAVAAVIPVTTTDDISADDDVCSLIEAVTAAELNSNDGDDCVATGTYGNDTIDLDGLVYEVTAGEIQLKPGVVPGTLTFDGVPGSTVIRRSIAVNRIFTVETNAVVEIEGVILENGRVPDAGVAPAPGDPGANGGGGGCILSQGTLTVRDSAVRNCQAGAGGGGGAGAAEDPGGNGGNGGAGGGILASGGSLTLIGTEVTGNKAGAGGGGGAGGAGTNGGLGGNGGTGGAGGGIVAAVPVEITGGTFVENEAGAGGAGGTGGDGTSGAGDGEAGGNGGPGGAMAVDGDLTMENVTVSLNAAGNGGAGGDGGQIGADTIGRGGDGGDGGAGGGLATAVGAAQLEAVTIDDNNAGAGGQGGLSNPSAPVQVGDGGSGGGGGGWYLENPGLTELLASTVTGNTAGSAGGGSGFATETRGGPGGGIRVVSASLNVERSTIAGNTAGGVNNAGDAGSGGGLSLFTSAMSMQRSAVTGNQAGVAADATAGDGGGIHADDIGEVGIHSSTIAENSAGTATDDDGFDGRGGGIMQADTDTILFVVGSTVAGNSVPAGSVGGGLSSDGEINLLSTIVAGNQAGTESYNCGSGIVDQAFNLTSDDSCVGTVGDAKLGPLANNGGPTETMGLRAGSAALDQVPEGGPPGDACPTTDQRGVERPVGGACDIGAFEGVLPSGGPGPGGPSGPAGPGGPAAKAAFGRSALIRLSLGAKTIKSKGPVAVVIANGNAFKVTGRLSAATTKPVATAAAKKRKKAKRISLKAKRFTVAGSRKKTVKLKLPAKLRRLLKRTGKFSLRVKVVVTDPSGNRRNVSRVVRLKLKKPKRKK